jgi:hypothetical protein
MAYKKQKKETAILSVGEMSGFLCRFHIPIGGVPFSRAFVNLAYPNNLLMFNGTGEPAGFQNFLPLLTR